MSSPRLGLATLDRLAREHRPRTDPRSRTPRIVHLGIGAFHRAHQAVYTEDAAGDWGICGVTQRSRGVLDQLVPQDGLYTVIQRSAGEERLRVIGAVREVVCASDEPGRVLARIAAPATAVVTLTVTEKGYHHDPATHRLRLDSPAIAADVSDGTARTPVAQLARGLDRRRRGGGGPLTVVSCDNLRGNGGVLRGLVDTFAGQMDDAASLCRWLHEQVRFPCTMVDRIVPATTDADRLAVACRLGLRDEGAVVTEPFSQWVIEDDFAGPRPDWEAAGAILTADVAPYEQIKLRLLNGSHSAIAYLGALADHELVADAVAPGTPIREVARRLMADDAAPTLAVPEDFELGAYQHQLMERFANPALRHRTLQIAIDGSQKLPERLLATIRDRRRAGALPAAATLAVAAWMRFVTARRSDGGRPLPVDDPLAGEIAGATAGRDTPAGQVDALLAMRAVFSADLAADETLRGRLTEWLEVLARDGAERAAERVST